jgi:hypothetical protein
MILTGHVARLGKVVGKIKDNNYLEDVSIVGRILLK